MGQTTTGLFLQQYVAPQLLEEFKNYKDDFIGTLKGAPADAITADGIRFNRLINNVSFYVNNSANFTPTTMNGEKVFVEWEKYDTSLTPVTDAEVRSLAFDKRAEVRVKHSQAMKMGLRNHVMWKLAPEDSTKAGMPVMRTTGETVGTRKRLTFRDAVSYLEMVKALNLPIEDELYMILCREHVSDLIVDRDSAKFFADSRIFFDSATGKVRSILGFKFFENNSAVAYDQTGNKKPEGSVLTATDRNASLFYYGPNTVYHLNEVKVLYKPETIDTRSADPTSEFRLQTYGLVDRILDYGVGAIVSGIA